MVSCQPGPGYFQIRPICGGHTRTNHRGLEIGEVEEEVVELREKVTCKLRDAAVLVGEIIDVYVSLCNAI